MRFYVYQLRASDEALPFYIGKTFIGSSRFQTHLWQARRGTQRSVYTKIRSIISRGASVTEEPLEWFDTEEQAYLREVDLIAHYGRKDNNTGILTNHNNGGGGCVVVEDTGTNSTQTKTYGKPITAFDESGQVVGHYHSSRAAADALNVSYKTIYGVLSGQTGFAKGINDIKYRFSYGTIVDSIQMFEYNRGNGKIIQISVTGEFIAEFSNANQAAVSTGIAPQSIRYCAAGKAKTAGGFHWQYQSAG